MNISCSSKQCPLFMYFFCIVRGGESTKWLTYHFPYHQNLIMHYHVGNCDTEYISSTYSPYMTESLHPLKSTSPYSFLPAPGNHHSMVLLWVWLLSIPHISASSVAGLFQLAQCSLDSPLLLQMAKFPPSEGRLKLHCMWHPIFFVCSSIRGLWGCFHFLVMVDPVAMNTAVQLYPQDLDFGSFG